MKETHDKVRTDDLEDTFAWVLGILPIESCCAPNAIPRPLNRRKPEAQRLGVVKVGMAGRSREPGERLRRLWD